MAYHNGRLYVTCAGGYQGPNSVGDVWQVSISGAKMTAAQVLDGADSKFYFEVGGYPVNVGMYGIQFAADGTAYLLTGSYTDEDPSDRSQRFRCRLFVTTEAAMAAGNPGTVAATYTTNTGYSWGILWDEPSSVLWVMTGTRLEARHKSGERQAVFVPFELGDNVYSVSLLNGVSVGDSPAGDGDGGGGGCDTGALAPLVALAALTATVCLALRSRRRQAEREK